MPLLERTAAAHPRLQVVLIDERDDRAAALQFVSDLRIVSPVAADSEGTVGDAYGISGLPATVFIRADGTIEGRYIGETSPGILAPHLDAIGAQRYRGSRNRPRQGGRPWSSKDAAGARGSLAYLQAPLLLPSSPSPHLRRRPLHVDFQQAGSDMWSDPHLRLDVARGHRPR